ncbi:MAG: hypothetical protein DCC67_18635 [Planctomycetota bacterium]|nr:MAG: hypothetical protein DCC67_18635 [Planctomycetota bacterium]
MPRMNTQQVLYCRCAAALFSITLLLLAAAPACGAIHASVPAYRLDIGDARDVERNLKQEIARAGDDPFALHDLGTVLFRQGRSPEARELWDKAASMHGDLAAADVEIAFAQIDSRQFDEARQSLTALQQRRPKDPHVQLALGQLAVATGEITAAKAAYDAAQALAPKSAAVSLARGRFLQLVGQSEEGRRSFQTATEVAPDQEDNIEECLRLLQRAETCRPGQPLAEARLAELYMQAGDFPLAYKWFHKALARQPEDNLLACRAAQMLMTVKRPTAARQILDAVLKRAEYVPALVTLAQLEESQGNTPRAVELLERVLKQDERNVLAVNNLAMTLVQTGQDAERALRLAEAAMQLADTPEIASTFGCALVHAGQYERAAEVLRRSVRTEPSDAWIRFSYGVALAKLGQAEKAAEQFGACLLLDANFPRTEEIKQLTAAKK